MKRAFTLVEMLVVVVVLVILMSVTFKLFGLYADQTARGITIARLQKLENCLSGYYAAFGSYPPVPLHGVPDPYMGYNKTEWRQTGRLQGSVDKWSSYGACWAQPVSLAYQDPKLKGRIDAASKGKTKIAHRGGGGSNRPSMMAGFTVITNPNDFKDRWSDVSRYYDPIDGETSKNQVQAFRFGLLSFLLPRYYIMLKGQSKAWIEALDTCAQWNANNRLSANQDSGKGFKHWSEEIPYDGASDEEYQWHLIDRIPSQSVVKRWLPNLAGNPENNDYVIRSEQQITIGGIPLSKGGSLYGERYGLHEENISIEICEVDGHYFWPCVVTALDGWNSEFFYHSDPPYQSYMLWSAGKDGATFPPWYPLDKLKSEGDRRYATNAMRDDIIFMSNGN